MKEKINKFFKNKKIVEFFKKRKKTLLIVSAIVLIGIVILILCLCNRNFYLNEKYYKEGIINDILYDDLKQIEKNKESFILYTYNDYCTLQIPCGDIFKQAAVDNNITILSIRYEEFKKSSYHNTVKFAPSVIIFKEGKIVSYLDSEKDEDFNKYQDVQEFTKWLEENIYLSKK